MRRRKLLILAVTLLVISTLACSLFDGKPEEEPTEVPATAEPLPTDPPPTEAPSPTEPSTEPSDGATVVLNNNSDEVICYVRISPSSASTWGDDQLGSSEVIGPGESRTFEVSPDTYDLRAEDCSNTEIGVEWEVNVTDTYTWNVSGGGGGGDDDGGGGDLGTGASIVLNNNSEQGICYVRISPASATTWGDDQLGPTEIVGVGESRTFEVSPGTYDLRAENCGNDEIDVQWDVNVSGTYTWDITGGPELEGTATLIMNNNSGQTICYVRISPASASTWGEDYLGGSEVIGPGESRTWSDLPADIYDLRAEDCDNAQIDVEWGVSLSGTYTWNVGE